jgi:hypothetical protein
MELEDFMQQARNRKTNISCSYSCMKAKEVDFIVVESRVYSLGKIGE